MWSESKILCIIFSVVACSGGLLASVDVITKENEQLVIADNIKQDSTHKVFHQLNNRLSKVTKNITQNPQLNEKLNMLAKQLVSSILTKMDAQARLARLTREALQNTGKNKGVTAIETRRILDYISRTMSSQILSFTRSSAEPDIHRLVYGLSQTAAEIAVISALKDITYASALSKKQVVKMSFRRKRSIVEELSKSATTISTDPDIKIMNFDNSTNKSNKTDFINGMLTPQDRFSVLPVNQKSAIHVLNEKQVSSQAVKGFLNQTVLNNDNNGGSHANDSETLMIANKVNNTNYVKVEEESDWLDDLGSEIGNDFTDEIIYKPALNDELIAEIEIVNGEVDNDTRHEIKVKQKLDRLESKARKAIIYAGDVAYLTAASVVALRRALTASIEVQMSVNYATNGLSNHQELMMNLAKTAAQQAGKEAKSATSKSLACERALQLALKYTAQSNGAKLNHVANRMIMDAIALSTIAKSMAYVSSEIAMNSLYQATDLKQIS